MGKQMPSVTKNTLLPIGIVIVLVGLAWTLATDRQQALSDIMRNGDAITRHDNALEAMREDMDYLAGAMIRIEQKLGTQQEKPK